MAKLAGNAVVYWDGDVIHPGDDLPAELSHLGEAPDDDSPAGTQGAGGGSAVNPDFNPEKATVPQLRDELTRLEVEFDEGDRKDALVEKYKARVA